MQGGEFDSLEEEPPSVSTGSKAPRPLVSSLESIAWNAWNLSKSRILIKSLIPAKQPPPTRTIPTATTPALTRHPVASTVRTAAADFDSAQTQFVREQRRSSGQTTTDGNDDDYDYDVHAEMESLATPVSHDLASAISGLAAFLDVDRRRELSGVSGAALPWAGHIHSDEIKAKVCCGHVLIECAGAGHLLVFSDLSPTTKGDTGGDTDTL